MRSRDWVWTLNNYDADDLLRFRDQEEQIFTGIKYFIVNPERAPSTNTPHLQGFVQFEREKSLRAAQKCLSGSFARERYTRFSMRVRRGTPRQARDYCNKDDSRDTDVSNTSWSYGEFSAGQGTRSDLKSIADDIESGDSVATIAVRYPSQFMRYNKGIYAFHGIVVSTRLWEPPVVYIFWGPTGAGKSYAARNDFVDIGEYGQMMLRQGSQGELYFEQYEHQPVWIIDEFNGEGQMKLQFFLQIVDEYPVTVPKKYGSCRFDSKVLVFCSNMNPLSWYKHDDPQYPAYLRRLRDRIRIFYFYERERLEVNDLEDLKVDYFDGGDIPVVRRMREFVRRRDEAIDLECNEVLDQLENGDRTEGYGVLDVLKNVDKEIDENDDDDDLSAFLPVRLPNILVHPRPNVVPQDIEMEENEEDEPPLKKRKLMDEMKLDDD